MDEKLSGYINSQAQAPPNVSAWPQSAQYNSPENNLLSPVFVAFARQFRYGPLIQASQVSLSINDSCVCSNRIMSSSSRSRRMLDL